MIWGYPYFRKHPDSWSLRANIPVYLICSQRQGDTKKQFWLLRRYLRKKKAMDHGISNSDFFLPLVNVQWNFSKKTLDSWWYSSPLKKIIAITSIQCQTVFQNFGFREKFGPKSLQLAIFRPNLRISVLDLFGAVKGGRLFVGNSGDHSVTCSHHQVLGACHHAPGHVAYRLGWCFKVGPETDR